MELVSVQHINQVLQSMDIGVIRKIAIFESDMKSISNYEERVFGFLVKIFISGNAGSLLLFGSGNIYLIYIANSTVSLVKKLATV